MSPHAARAAFLASAAISSAMATGLSGGDAASIELRWHSLDGGGGVSTGASIGGQLTLRGTIGQADAAVASGGSLVLRAGFWPGPTTPETPPCEADLDGSGTVDAADLAILLGAWGPADGGCEDLNADGVVDAADLALLLGAWGPFD